jgi:hypothetical protein
MSDEYEKTLNRYKAARDYITHEDSLINNRLTWLLVSQGLTFSAFSALFKPISDIIVHLHGDHCLPEKAVISLQETMDFLEGLQFILSFLGLCISVISFLGVQAAVRAIRKVSGDYEEVSKKAELPGLIGGGSEDAHNFGILYPRGIPIVLFFAWLFVILIQHRSYLLTNYQLYLVGFLGFIIGTTSTIWIYWFRYGLSTPFITHTCTRNKD